MNQTILESKKKVVAELVEQFKAAKSVVVVDYRGLTVSEISELRKQLREADATLGVYKNTLVQKANDSLGHEELDQYLSGSNAYVFCSDVIAAPKIIAKYARKNDKLSIKAGLIEGRVMDADGVKEVAKLPGREGLISMFLSCLQAPIRSFACTVKAVADSKN